MSGYERVGSPAAAPHSAAGAGAAAAAAGEGDAHDHASIGVAIGSGKKRSVATSAAALIAFERPFQRRSGVDAKEADAYLEAERKRREEAGYDSDADDAARERAKEQELEHLHEDQRALLVEQGASAAHAAEQAIGAGAGASQAADEVPIPITLTWNKILYVLNTDEAKATTSWGAIPRPPPDSPDAAPLLTGDRTADNKEPEHKVVLNNVSGYCRPGTFTAILGSSGAGKTSLLNILSQRNKDYSGEVMLNGKLSSKSLLHHTAFVEQTDMFFAKLSVREHLETQARLRLPDSMPAERRAVIVEKVIHSLGLKRVADTGNPIGGNGMGLSGGERRRLTFATELLTNPSLLLLDEPTSGLDSMMAGEVLRQLRSLADEGRTIVCTVHQPDAHVFALFHKVIIMAEGQVAYFGPGSGLIDYMAGPFGHPYVRESEDNVATQFIRHISIGSKGNSWDQVDALLNAYKACDLYRHMERKRINHTKRLQIANHVIGEVVAEKYPDHKPDEDEVVHRSSWCTQFQALSQRSWISLKRDQGYLSGRLTQQIVVNAILGLIALRLANDQVHLANKIGALFFIMWNTTFSSVWSVTVVFPPEMPLFIREYKAGLYRADTFFLARNLVELPAQILFPLIYATVSYWMCGFNDNGLAYVRYIFALCYAANAAASLGYVISCIGGVRSTPDITPLILFPFLICGGLILSTASIPAVFRWLVDISVFHDAYELMMISVFKGYTIGCDTSLSSTVTCQFTTGEELLSSLGFSASHVPIILVRMMIYFVLFRAIAFAILVARGRAKNAKA